jgi:hypothetical protein
VLLVGVVLVCAGLAGAIASAKGRPVPVSMLLGACLGPFGLVVVAALPAVDPGRRSVPGRPGGRVGAVATAPTGRARCPGWRPGRSSPAPP